MSTTDLMDALAKLVENAKQIPLTDQVRLNRGKVYSLLDELKAALPPELDASGDLSQPARRVIAAAGRFDAAVHQARAVPLTNDVRLAREDADRLVEELQATLAQALAPAADGPVTAQPDADTP